MKKTYKEYKDSWWVVVWHNITSDANGDIFGMSSRFAEADEAKDMMASLVLDEIEDALDRDHKAVATWYSDKRTVRVEEDCGHEVVFQVVEVYA